MRFLLVALLLLSYSSAFSQVTPADSVKIDTVIIYKAPLRIKKTVFVEDTAGRVKPIFWLSGFGALFTNYNYYLTCNCYEAAFADIKKATTKKTGNMEGISLNYLYKRFYAEASFFLTNYREGFKYDSVSTTNNYHYSSISISPGYLLVKSKVSVIVSAGYVLNRLNSYNGLTINLAEPKVVDITGERKFVKYSSGGIANVKFLYTLHKRLDGIIDLFYMADLHSVAAPGQTFVLQRNSVGVKVGLGFRF